MQMTEKISVQINHFITTNKVIGNFIRAIDENYKDEAQARKVFIWALKNPSYIQNEVEKIKAEKIMEGEDIDDNQVFYNLMMVKTKPFFDISFESSLPVFSLRFVWKMWCCVHDEKGKSKVPLWFEKEVKKKFHYLIFKRIIKKSNLKIKAGNTCLESTTKFPVNYYVVTKDKLKAGDAYEYSFTDVTYQGLLSIHRKYDRRRCDTES